MDLRIKKWELHKRKKRDRKRKTVYLRAPLWFWIQITFFKWPCRILAEILLGMTYAILVGYDFSAAAGSGLGRANLFNSERRYDDEDTYRISQVVRVMMWRY